MQCLEWVETLPAWNGFKTYQLVLEPGQVYVLEEGP